MLKFITGNKHKYREFQIALDPIKVQKLHVDLEEIQDIDPRKVLLHKLKDALKHGQREIFIDDTCVYYDALNKKLPGPFIRWFLEELKPAGLYNLAKKLGNTQVKMQTVIAYAKGPKDIYFFEGTTYGKLVKPKGGGGFGVDTVLQPKGYSQTLAELKEGGKFSLGSRFRAAGKFKKFLLKNAKSK